MEEQLALIEKLKNIGIELTPEERLESIEGIEQFLETLNEVDRTLERRRQAMLNGKDPDSLADDLDEAYASLERGESWVNLAIMFVPLEFIAVDLGWRIVSVAILIAFIVATVWLVHDAVLAKVSSFFRRRLVRGTKEYGQIIEAQAQLKRFSIQMKLKQIELLVKRV